MLEFDLIKNEDISEICDLVIRACKFSSFADFYPTKYFYCTDEEIRENAENGHFYAVKEDGKIIGCGGIRPYQGSQTESLLFMIFVEPALQHSGIGRKIVAFLENDEYARRASRLVIHAAISAVPFYRKLGYEHNNGDLTYEKDHFDLEKFLHQEAAA